MLSEGYTIYNGPPKDIKNYFEQFGLKMSKFSNPADKLTLIASVPKRMLNPDTSIVELAEECKLKLTHNQIIFLEDRIDLITESNINLSHICRNRNVS